MIGERMQDALNAHVTAEVSSAYLYLAMSAHCERLTLKGFGRWLRVQSREELGHATKLLDYLVERGGRAALGAVAAPPADFGDALAVFETVQRHEQHVSELVRKLHDVAVAEKDLAAQLHVQWFVAEQVEEEARVAEIVEKLRMVGDRAGTVLYLDKEYGKREPAKGA